VSQAQIPNRASLFKFGLSATHFRAAAAPCQFTRRSILVIGQTAECKWVKEKVIRTKEARWYNFDFLPQKPWSCKLLKLQRKVRFGPFDLDSAGRGLRKHGLRIRLSEQPFRVLIALLEAQGEVVTREALHARLWPHNNYGDVDHGLNVAIKKLRDALGDSATEPRFIATVDRVGYRFIAAIEKLGNDTVPATSQPIALPNRESAGPANIPLADLPKSGLTLKGRWRTTLLACFAIFGGLVSIFSLVSKPIPRVLSCVPLTTSARVDGWGRLTTDGVRLFFLERRGDHWNLMQESVTGGESQPFPQLSRNLRILDISRDGAQLLVGEFEERGPVRLKIMTAVGGQPRRVNDLDVEDAIFTVDGHEITYSTENGIYSADLSGSNPKRIFYGKGAKVCLGWRPDGKVLRFAWEHATDQKTEIWEVPREGGMGHSVLPGWNPSPSEYCGRWSLDGRYYIFVSEKGGVPSLWAKRENAGWLRPARQPVQLTTGPISFHDVLVGRQRGLLFALGGNDHNEFVRFDPDRGQFLPMLGGVTAFWPDYSPDTNWVVYYSGSQLWISRPDGTDRRQLTSEAHFPKMPRWSRDGKEILYLDGRSDGTVGMYLISADGGAPRPLSTADLVPNEEDWSPDGTSIVFSARSFNNSPEKVGLYLLRLKSGQVERVAASEGLAKAHYSPDGRYLGAESDDESRVMLLDLRTNSWKEIRKGKVFGPLAWSRDSKYLFFQDILEQDQPVWKIKVQDGQLTKVVDFRNLLEGNAQRCGFEALARDGSVLVRVTTGDKNVYALNVTFP